MQMTPEARAWLDATVRRILARHPVGDAERAGITYELMSHLHAVAQDRATAAGRTQVAREDLEAAWASAGSDLGLAAAFVEPLAKPVERASFLLRGAAGAFDLVVVLFILGGVHTLLEYALRVHMGIVVSPDPATMPGWMKWIPWGYHDPGLGFALQGVFTVASAAAVLGYLAWTEAHSGRTLGKRAFGLRVMRDDGLPVSARDAVARNLVKLSPPLFAADVIFMLLAWPDAKQRLSDRIAHTIVVRA